MINAIYGKKVGKTQVFSEDDRLIPVTVIQAKVPLGQMFGYATDLRSGTQGRAVYTMQFDSYEAVPKSVAEEIISKAGGNA